MYNILEDIPSVPEITSIANTLHVGITTRVLAKKLALEREKAKYLQNTEKEAENENKGRRRSSRFLEGAAIPNSTIKADIENPEPPQKSRTAIRKERDDFVAKITNRLQPRNKMFPSIYDEDVDREALNKIKDELQRRSLLPINREKVEEQTSISNTSTSNNPWEKLKEKRRISRRTSVLTPLVPDTKRRSTYESIKSAIQNTNNIPQLIDADHIDEQKMKQTQARKTSMFSTGVKESTTESKSSQGSSANIRGMRRDSEKEKNITKRKPSLKSEKSLNLPHSERPSVRIKTSSESRRFSKRSHVKLLKETLGKQTSSVTTNILQQRRNAIY